MFTSDPRYREVKIQRKNKLRAVQVGDTWRGV